MSSEHKYEVPHNPSKYESKGNEEKSVLKALVSGRPMFGQVDVFLGKDEKIVGDAGAMTWMDGNMPPIETDCYGGVVQSCARSCAGESCCFNTFTGPGRVGFGMPLPGDIEAFRVTPDYGWILSQGAFICGTANVKVSARFAGCCAACFSGEGVFLTKVIVEEGDGVFFAGGFGAIKRHDIPPGQTFIVDNGMFFAAELTTMLRIGIAGEGIKQLCCSGEGLVMQFHGPCTIFTQSRDPSIFRPPDPSQPGAGNAQ